MDVVQRAQAIVKRAEFPDLTKWNEALRDGHPYALVTILLSQLHNIRSLRLDYPPCNPDQFMAGFYLPPVQP